MLYILCSLFDSEWDGDLQDEIDGSAIADGEWTWPCALHPRPSSWDSVNVRQTAATDTRTCAPDVEQLVELVVFFIFEFFLFLEL